MSFGERLRGLREAAGLTQEELAARAGMTAKGISALERGERKRPYPHTVRSLASALVLTEDERDAFVRSVPGEIMVLRRPPGPRPSCPRRPPRSSGVNGKLRRWGSYSLEKRRGC
jgi:transcriptional regulator with XRE-family HTH domain